jgi:hypothetical protein
MVFMVPYDPKALMRFIAYVFLNGLSTKEDTFVDTTASLNFVSKDLFMANGFYKDYKIALKLAIRIANAHRIYATTKICPSFFTIDGL